MKPEKWAWWEILLWSYSTIYFIILILFFIVGATTPSTDTSNSNSSAILIGLVVFTLPTLAFLVLEGIKHLRDNN